MQPFQRGFEVLAHLIRIQLDVLQIIDNLALPLLFAIVEVPASENTTVSINQTRQSLKTLNT